MTVPGLFFGRLLSGNEQMFLFILFSVVCIYVVIIFICMRVGSFSENKFVIFVIVILVILVGFSQKSQNMFSLLKS